MIRQVLAFAEQNGYTVTGLDFSPVKGPEGNIEYLAALCHGEEGSGADWEEAVDRVVDAAHDTLN